MPITASNGGAPGFDAYIGLDQTGAVGLHGFPKPYPAAVLWRGKREEWRLRTGLGLARFSERGVRELLRDVTGSAPYRTLIAVDVAIGTPAGLGLSLPALLSLARGFEINGQAFGMHPANEFYRRLWRPPGEHGLPSPRPARLADIVAGANSPFEPYPFQKNIACGSYRFLRELSDDPSWCRVWPFQKIDGAKFVVAEAYPSLLWREIFGERVRAPGKLTERLRGRFAEEPGGSGALGADHADAAVLALGARELAERTAALKVVFPPFVRRREGWILGLAEGSVLGG